MTLQQRLAAVLAAIGADIKVKADIAAEVLTDPALTFVRDGVLGTPVAPITANLTSVTTSAKVGTVITIIHNSVAEPTFDSKFKRLSGSGPYVVNVNNYIICEYVGNDIIIYSINQLV